MVAPRKHVLSPLLFGVCINGNLACVATSGPTLLLGAFVLSMARPELRKVSKTVTMRTNVSPLFWAKMTS